MNEKMLTFEEWLEKTGCDKSIHGADLFYASYVDDFLQEQKNK